MTPQTQGPRGRERCAVQALKQNAVALSFDVAGVGAGFLPGGDAVVGAVQIGLSTGGAIYSASQNDNLGAALNGSSIMVVGSTGLAEAVGGDFAKAVPVLGVFTSGVGFLHDAYHAYQGYEACMPGAK